MTFTHLLFLEIEATLVLTQLTRGNQDIQPTQGKFLAYGHTLFIELLHFSMLGYNSGEYELYKLYWYPQLYNLFVESIFKKGEKCQKSFFY